MILILILAGLIACTILLTMLRLELALSYEQGILQAHIGLLALRLPLVRIGFTLGREPRGTWSSMLGVRRRTYKQPQRRHTVLGDALRVAVRRMRLLRVCLHAQVGVPHDAQATAQLCAALYGLGGLFATRCGQKNTDVAITPLFTDAPATFYLRCIAAVHPWHIMRAAIKAMTARRKLK